MTSGRPLRVITASLVLAGALALALTSCPSNRNGVPGQLTTAAQEAQSAARSAAFALDAWEQRRSTGNLASVQLADALDETADALSGIAVVTTEAPDELRRQAVLTRELSTMVVVLNEAGAAVRGIPTGSDVADLRRRLLENAEALGQHGSG